MANKYFNIILFLIPCFIFSQNNENIFVKKGTVRAMATISPSKILSENLSPFYLHGNLEYYCEEKVSVSGDGYYFLGDMSKDKALFGFHHNVFFGANYHLINKNSDLYFGLHPGISITQINYFSTKISANPLVSFTIGYNFFFSRFFHFFVQFRNVCGENIIPVPLNISDIRISAGLGFHL